RSPVVECLGQVLDGLPFPLRDLVRMKLVLRRQFRNRPLAADRLKRNLGLELGRKSSACLHAGSSFSSSIHLMPLSQKPAPPLTISLSFPSAIPHGSRRA